MPVAVLVAAVVATGVVMRVEPSRLDQPKPVEPRPVTAMIPWSDQDSLPRLKSDFPVEVDPAAPTVPLAENPVERALALLQKSSSDPVLVLGDDWHLRSLGVLKMSPTSLSADGRTAVFPQPGSVLVVDLTTGRSRTVPVGGTNTHAAISPDGRQLLAMGSRGTQLVDAADGALIIRMADRKTPSSYSATDNFACGVVTGRNNPEYMISSFRTLEREGRTITHSLESMVDDVRGIPVARGNRIAVPARGKFAVRDVIVMTYFGFVPIRGAPPKVLGVPFGARPLRWFDDSTLLVLSGDRVLSWNVDTGEVSRVMKLLGRVEVSA
ncbi:hypothetical protein Lesp02_37230 [Lentzea sp. NBRC 105346]|nr:hypothetical protein Lesp02_37230 [Lentzea sp. NBRC 105346]